MIVIGSDYGALGVANSSPLLASGSFIKMECGSFIKMECPSFVPRHSKPQTQRRGCKGMKLRTLKML